MSVGRTSVLDHERETDDVVMRLAKAGLKVRPYVGASTLERTPRLAPPATIVGELLDDGADRARVFHRIIGRRGEIERRGRGEDRRRTAVRLREVRDDV